MAWVHPWWLTKWDNRLWFPIVWSTPTTKFGPPKLTDLTPEEVQRIARLSVVIFSIFSLSSSFLVPLSICLIVDSDDFLSLF